MRAILGIGLTLLVVAGLLLPCSARGDETADLEQDRVIKAEVAIRAKLVELDAFIYEDQPLSEVVEALKMKWDIPILLDTKALNEASVTPDQPVSINVPKLTRKSGLKLLLEPIELTYVIRDEVLVITTREHAKILLTVHFYDVRDLVAAVEQDELKRRKMFGDHDASKPVPAAIAGKPAEEKPTAKEEPKAGTLTPPDIKPQYFGAEQAMRASSQGGMTEVTPAAPLGFRPSEEIRTLTMETIAPDSWEPAGGPARISMIAGVMVVSQTTDVHENIENMLARLRKILRTKPASFSADAK